MTGPQATRFTRGIYKTRRTCFRLERVYIKVFHGTAAVHDGRNDAVVRVI